MSTESNNTPIDPRVQIELEKLNSATDNINRYEVELEEAKTEFKRILSESEIRIRQAAYKLGNSIDAAKPYYESRIYVNQLSKETQKAAVDFEKAKSIHAASKEMVFLAEQGMGETSTLDTACQEMLSHAASKVNQSQLDMTNARNSLKMCQLKLEVATNRVNKLQSQLKQAIKASRPFYETRANYNGLLKAQKQKINELEQNVIVAKMNYNEALNNLEKISEEIHHQRQLRKASHLDLDSSNKATHRHSFHQNFNRHIMFNNDDCNSPQHSKLNNIEKPFENDFENQLQISDSNLVAARGLCKSATEESLISVSLRNRSYNVNSNLIIPDGKQTNLLKPEESTTKNKISQATTSSVSSVDDDIEQWTEIRLSHSNSSSSSYSNQSCVTEQPLNKSTDAEDVQSHHSTGSGSLSSSDEHKAKVTCTTIFQDEPLSKKQTLSQWLTRSNNLRLSGRRQSLDLLIDAGDKVKDVFSLGLQKVAGRTLERRSSESEMNIENSNSTGTTPITGFGITTGNFSSSTTTNAADFFLFSRFDPKELLSDEQVENLLFNHAVDENGAIIVEEFKTPLKQSAKKLSFTSLMV